MPGCCRKAHGSHCTARDPVTTPGLNTVHTGPPRVKIITGCSRVHDPDNFQLFRLFPIPSRFQRPIFRTPGSSNRKHIRTERKKQRGKLVHRIKKVNRERFMMSAIQELIPVSPGVRLSTLFLVANYLNKHTS